MKKKILLIITFIGIIFIPNVRAEGNMKVIFNTSFEEQINIDDIDEIYIMMDDINLKDYEIVLERKSNFRYELTNLPEGDIVINSITVSRDYTVDYDYQYAITHTSEEETNISILVTKVSKDPNRKKVEVSNEYIAEILGYDPLKITSSESIYSKTTTKTTTTNNNENNDFDEPIAITSSTQAITNGDEHESALEEELKKEIEEEEKKQEQERRKGIYMLILIIIAIAIILLGTMAGIKIANANK